MLQFLFLSFGCSENSKSTAENIVDWQKNPQFFFERSQEWNELEQFHLLREVRDSTPNLVTEFCRFNHLASVEYECRIIKTRPHLLEKTPQKTTTSPLWDIAPHEKEHSITRRFEKTLHFAAKTSAEAVAKHCNKISDIKVRSECYFIAADSLNHDNPDLMQRWFRLCEAAFFFKSHCLSHNMHLIRTIDLSDTKGWFSFFKETNLLVAQHEQDKNHFLEVRLQSAVYRSASESPQLCFSEELLKESFGKNLMEALRFEFTVRSQSKKSFTTQVNTLRSLPNCIENSPPPSKIKFRQIPLPKGRSKPMMDRNKRLFDDDPVVDTALLLVEIAGLIGDKFLLEEGSRYPNKKVAQRAKELVIYFQNQ